MRRKGIAVLVSALMLAVSLTGCGKQEVLDGTETAATLDDTTSMTLGEFNLMLRYQEAQMEVEKFWMGALRRAVVEGDVETGSLMAGQSVGLMDRIVPVRELIDELLADASAELDQVKAKLS